MGWPSRCASRTASRFCLRQRFSDRCGPGRIDVHPRNMGFSRVADDPQTDSTTLRESSSRMAATSDRGPLSSASTIGLSVAWPRSPPVRLPGALRHGAPLRRGAVPGAWARGLRWLRLRRRPARLPVPPQGSPGPRLPAPSPAHRRHPLRPHPAAPDPEVPGFPPPPPSPARALLAGAGPAAGREPEPGWGDAAQTAPSQAR